MKTTLNADGEIGIPENIRDADHLAAGDSFELERLMSGHYVLTKQPQAGMQFSTFLESDGLPVIRTTRGIITSKLVKEIESQTP